MLILEAFMDKLSTHAQFSIFLGMAIFIIGTISAFFIGYSIAKVAMVSFGLTAVIYLIIDFYEMVDRAG